MAGNQFFNSYQFAVVCDSQDTAWTINDDRCFASFEFQRIQYGRHPPSFGAVGFKVANSMYINVSFFVINVFLLHKLKFLSDYFSILSFGFIFALLIRKSHLSIASQIRFGAKCCWFFVSFVVFYIIKLQNKFFPF